MTTNDEPHSTTIEPPTRLERARALDQRSRAIARKGFVVDAEAALALELLATDDLWEELCVPSLSAYAWDVYGFSAEKTRTLLRIVRKAPPKTREAFDNGTLRWAQVGELLKVLTLENEDDWLERAPNMTLGQLEREVAKLLGRKPMVAVSYRVSEEDKTVLEDLTGFMLEAGIRDRGAGLVEAARRVLGGKCEGIEPAARVTVYDYCARCGTTTREGLDGPVLVKTFALEQALCNAEVIDLRTPEAKLTRAIPSRIVDVVKARDRHRCHFPRCTNRAWVQLHHEGGWKNTGHDVDKIVPLCYRHHRQRHRGKYRIEIDRPVVRFIRRDGVLLGEVRTGESPMDAAQPKSPDDGSTSSSSSPAA